MDVTSNNSNDITPKKTRPAESSVSPIISRYGRTHKPKMEFDYVSTDKKVSAYLKISPGNQLQYFSNDQKKKPSPKKSSDGKETPRRGRPPKSPSLTPAGEIVVKAESKLQPQDPNSPVEGCEWMVGDLAWARVGGHPFWPCIIALDPVQRVFTKTVNKGRSSVSQRWVHVQFFGDNGRRSWLNSTSVMCYNGRDAFIQLGDTILAGMRKKEPKQTSAFIIKPAVIQVWEKAVQEAEDLANSSREDRVAFFTKNFPPAPPPPVTRDQLIDRVLLSETTSPKKRGKKRKAEQSPMEQETKNKQIKLEEIKGEASADVDPLLSSTPRTIADRKKRQALLIQLARTNQSPPSTSPPSDLALAVESVETPCPDNKVQPLKRPNSAVSNVTVEEKKPKKKKYKKRKVSVDFQAFSSKHFDRVADDHPDLNEKEISKYLQKLWNEMDDTQKAKYKSRLTGGQEKEESADESPEDAETEEVEEEERSSKSSSPVPLATPSQKPASAKRNNFKNLFSGAKAEKVCQICEKPGDTVRCRGLCQGYYHQYDCGNDNLAPAVIDTSTQTPGKKKGRPRKSLVESPQLLKDDCNATKENGHIADSVQTLKKPDGASLVEVVEPEVKSAIKPRKGSKDNESSSSEEGEGFRCKDCLAGRSQPCFICHNYVHKSGETKLYRCITAYCGKVYHEECLKQWPQTVWRANGNGKGIDRGVLTCPQHTCHTCASDNPGVIKARYSNDKLVRCVRCPTTYHYGNYCLPAGSEILNNTQIICPQHYKPAKKSLIQHVNAAWCFICASGGSLICCDLCPTSFHADCLKITTPPDGSYVCDDCQTGRFPLYGEIIWVKLGTYRWWPAEILYPALIPDNILNLPHVHGEFAVKFFGSHDHYWVNRGRVFLYQDGDTAGKSHYKKSSVDNVFERAVSEASEAQRKYLEEKATRDAETRPGMKPPNYVKLKTNKPVGNVRTMDLNVSSLTPCECDPKGKAPCAPDSDCLNRILMVECHPLVCPAGEKCCNQLFEKRLYPLLQPYHTLGRGWGLKTLVPLKKGDFVIEYVGEMIDEEEYRKRVTQMHENNEENFYFLTIDKDRMLDAGPKGNMARFMNHSCQPNCETQKWTVNGDTRVGLFALYDIPADTELVFNYNLESTGSDKKPCMCGAPNCSGFIGVKVTKNQDKEEPKDKKIVKKKKIAVAKAHEEECFICGEGGELLLCDGKHCTKGYHQSCLGKKQRPQGYWLCPWHQCNVCNKGRVSRCGLCVNSYCQEHTEGNIRLDPVKGLLCSKHDKEKTNITNLELESASPMEVDECGTENAVPTAVTKLDSAIVQEELTNNNVIKRETPAGRRLRRSKSDSSPIIEKDNVVIKKLNKRKARQSSVDASFMCTLISSEPDKPQEVEMKSTDEGLIKECESTSHPIKNQVPVQNNDFTTEKVTENVDNSLPVEKSTVKEDTDKTEDISGKLLDKNNLKGSIDETKNIVLHEKTPHHPKSSSTETQGNVNSLETESASQPVLTDLKQQPENEHLNSRSPTEEHKETHNPSKTHENTTENSALSKADHASSNSIVDHNNMESSYLSTEENKVKELLPEKLIPSDQEDKGTTFVTNISNSKHLSSTNSGKQINGMGTTGENDLGIDLKHSNKAIIKITKVEKGEIKQEQDNINVPSTVLHVDEQADDFELSYSEFADDNTYKSISNSESSLEMKLTDCTSSESSESEQLTNKIEQLSSQNGDLVKCIEQSSAMEVV